MRVLTIIQNKSQLEDVYGKPGALTLMSNHALMIMYAPSPVVQSDANEYSEILGYQTVKTPLTLVLLASRAHDQIQPLIKESFDASSRVKRDGYVGRDCVS